MTKHLVKNDFPAEEALQEEGKPLPFAPANPSTLLRGDHIQLLGLHLIGKSNSERPLLRWCAGYERPHWEPRQGMISYFHRSTEEQIRITMRAYDSESFLTASGKEQFSTGAIFLSLILVSKSLMPSCIIKVRIIRM